MKSCKTHFREISSLKNVKIASASFRDCSPVQVFDSYVQILHSEDDIIKKRNSIAETGSGLVPSDTKTHKKGDQKMQKMLNLPSPKESNGEYRRCW